MHDQPTDSLTTRRVLVCGYFGFANTGDEAILMALVNDLRAAHPGAEVVVIAGSPGAVAADYGVEAFHWQDISRLVDEAKRADLMVLGGGGLFQDHHGFDPDLILTRGHGSIGCYAGFALLAGMTSTPLVIYCVGVGPLSTQDGRRYTRISFGRASAASVRDEQSLALLARIGADTTRVQVTADPAWALEPAAAGTAEQILNLEGVAPLGSSTIGVVVRPWGTGAWSGELATALDRLVAARDARILFVPFQDSPHSHENDAHAALSVMRQMKRMDRASIIRGAYTPEERMAIIGSCDLMIGMRLHSVIFAARMGTPVVALSYDPKVDAAVRQIGTVTQVVDLSAITAEAVVASASHAAPAAGELVAELRERAGRNQLSLTQVRPPPRPDPETVDAYLALTISRIQAQARLESGISAPYQDGVSPDHAVLKQRYHEIVSSRMYRLASAVWRLRRGMRSWRNRIANTVPGLEQTTSTQPIVPTRSEESVDAAIRTEIEKQIREMLAAHADTPGVVVFPPTIGWRVTLFQRPQQMALAFARLGYVVLYGLDDASGECDMGLHEVSPRVYLTKIPAEAADLLKAIPNPIAVCYVYNFQWTKRLEKPAVIFEHIDELEVFETSYALGALRSWYAEVVEDADLVAASARTLLAKIRNTRPDAVLCPNGVDYRFFADVGSGDPPADIAPLIGRPIIGYYGAIAEWLDFSLIARAASELAEYEFIFIGPLYADSVSSRLEVFERPNVHWLGPKPYQELPAYLHAFDVATIPFLVNEVTHAVSPVKLFEYMAGGCPVVTPDLHECASMKPYSSRNFSISQGTALVAAARSRMRSGSGAISPCCPMRSPR
jgi:polysaccharide pyruvyl transferase CsaB